MLKLSDISSISAIFPCLTQISPDFTVKFLNSPTFPCLEKLLYFPCFPVFLMLLDTLVFYFESHP